MSIDISIACFLGSLGQKCWSLLSSSLQDTALEVINKPLLQRGDVSLGESRVFTLTEAIIFKECFRGRFPGTASAHFDRKPSTASDRESAVRNSINMATSKLLCFRSFYEESVSAYLLSPVLGRKHHFSHMLLSSVKVCLILFQRDFNNLNQELKHFLLI